MSVTAYGVARGTDGRRRLSVDEVWQELGATMRSLRSAAGVSLRRAEEGTGRGRGMLSQIETGKARPPRDVVEYYDEEFGGDHLLISLYAEARGAHGPEGIGRSPASAVPAGDAMVPESVWPAAGWRLAPGSQLVARWTLRNTGTVSWSGRTVRRVGPAAAPRLLGSAASTPLATTAVGETAVVEMPLIVPPIAGTFAAYWEIVDGRGVRCFGRDKLLPVIVTADW